MPGAKAPGILLRRRRACAFPVGCRGGFHIRPQTLIPPRTRRDEGIPPYVLPDGRNRPFCPAHLPSFAGNGLDRSASPCAAAGLAGISGLKSRALRSLASETRLRVPWNRPLQGLAPPGSAQKKRPRSRAAASQTQKTSNQIRHFIKLCTPHTPSTSTPRAMRYQPNTVKVWRLT